MPEEGKGNVNPVLEQRKIAYATVAALLASALILVAPILIATGASVTTSLILVLALAIFLVSAFMMELAWDSWGLKFGALLTALVVVWMILNLNYGR